MAVDLLNFGFKIDTNPLKSLQKGLDDVSRSANKLSDDLSKTGDKSTKAAKDTGSLTGQLKALAGAYISLAGVARLGQTVDDYTRFSAQLKNATTSQKDFQSALQNSFEIAQKAQVSIDAVASTYARLTRATADLGVNQQQVSNLTETISLALKVSGASAAESAGAMLQLSQAFGAGALMGEEFRSVAENAPLLLRALSKELGVSVGDLKKMASEGELTVQKLFAAWNNPDFLYALREQAKNVVTVSGAYQQFKNELTVTIGEIDKASGFSRALATSIKGVAQNLDILIPLVAGASVVFLGMSAPAIIGGIGSLAAGLATMVGLLAGPVGIVALLVAAGTAFLMFNNKGSEGVTSALEKLRQVNEELKLTNKEAATAGVNTEIERVLQTMDDANAKRIELIEKQKQLNETSGLLVFSDLTNVKLINEQIQRQSDIVAGATIQYGELLEKQKEINTQFDELGNVAPSWAKITAELKLGSVAKADYAKQSKEIAEAGKLEGKSAAEISEAQAALAQKLGLNKKAKVESNMAALELSNTYAELGKAIVDANKPIQTQSDKLQELLDSISMVQPAFKEWAQSEIDYARDKEYLQAFNARIDAYDSMLDSIRDSISEQEAENQVLAKTSKSIADVTISRLEERKAILESVGVSGEAIEQLQKEIDLRKQLKNTVMRSEELTKANEYIKEQSKKAQEAQKEIVKQNQQMTDDLNRSLTDALLRGFESGLGFAENFKRSLINMFKTVVLQPIISAVLKPVTDTVGSIVSGITGSITGTGSTGGITDIASTLGGIGNLFQNLNTSIVSGVASFGQALSNFGATGSSFLTNTASSLGSFVQLNQELIAKAVPFLDAGVKLLSGDVKGAAFSAGGAAFGGYLGSLVSIGGPVGTILGTVAGSVLNKIFGGKEQPPRTVTKLPDVAEAFNQSLSALLKSFGGAGNVTSTASFKGRAGGSGYGDLNAIVDGKKISDMIQYKDAYSEKTMQEFITRTLTETLTKAIESTNIDQAFKNLFAGITDRDEMGKTIQAVLALNNNNKQLTNTLGVTATQVALLAKESGIAGDSLISFVNTLNGISNELFTTGDALVAIKAGIDGAFTTLSDSKIPANLKEFDEAIKALDKTTAEGRQDFLGLVSIRQTFAEFENAIASLRGNVRSALFSISDDGERLAMMQEDLAKQFADVNLQVPETVEKFKELINTVDFTTAAGINLASVMPALANAFNQTQDAADQARIALEAQAESARIALENIAKTQMQQIINSANEVNRIAQDNLQVANANADIARDNLMNSFDAERTRLQGIIDSVSSLRENLATAFDAERSRLQGVIDNVATLKENLATAFSAEKDRLQSIVDNVDTFKDALRQAFDTKRNGLQSVVDAVGSFKQQLSDVIDIERNRLQGIISNVDNFKDALRQAFDTKASGLQDTISKFKDFGKTIRDFRKGLLQTSTVVSDPLSFNRARFLETASLAKAGDTSAMDELTSVASDFLESSENYSRDFNQYQSDFLEVNRILADVENSTFASASVAELQLDLLKQQVGALINLDENILSVEEAIANLVDAQSQANIAQAEIARLNQIQAQYLGTSNESLMSVDEAIANLNKAQAEANAAQAEINSLNVLQTQLLGSNNESLVSLDEAMQNLFKAQAEANIAQAEIERLNVLQALFLGSSNETLKSVDDSIIELVLAESLASQSRAEIERLNVLQTLFLGSSNEALLSVDDSLIKLILAESLASQSQDELNALNNQQVSLLGAINQSVLSVSAAIAGFKIAVQAQVNAQVKASSTQTNVNNLQPQIKKIDTPESIYREYLGREADPAGLAFWQKEFGGEVDTQELRTFQKAVRKNQALGFEQTNQAKSFASLKFANGGAFTNGIVSRPTMFNTGVMGEAGSEAIMPLSNINGKLGVSTNNSEMVVQLKIISDKITRLESAQIATVLNTGKVAKIIERADNGDSINVTVTA